MAQYLYVCHFSNGHIKVGRSVSPMARIAQHEARVSCLGVELVEHFIVECEGHSFPAERELIEKCVAAAEKRNKHEWFEGLDFQVVSDWANEISLKKFTHADQAKTSIDRFTGIFLAVQLFDGSPTKLAEAVGGTVIRQHVEHWLKVGRVPTEHAAAVEAATDFSVMRWDLRPDDWLRIWPELAQHPSAPPIQQAEAGA